MNMMSRYFNNSNSSPAAAKTAEGMFSCANANRIMMFLGAVIAASIIICVIVACVRVILVAVLMVLGLTGALLVAGREIPKEMEYGLTA